MRNGQAGDPGPTALIQARDVGVRRSERWIIRHVDLKVGRGELIYLIGANGAGKSTFAKAVLGLIDVSEGNIDRAPSMQMGWLRSATAAAQSHAAPQRAPPDDLDGPFCHS